MGLKRKAVKVEELEPIVQAPVKMEHRLGPLGVYEPFTYDNYEWPSRTVKDRPKRRFCVYCSGPAEYKIWFQENGYQKIEELCKSCYQMINR